jgi:high-affinity Fe2+/Pb2+ permease
MASANRNDDSARMRQGRIVALVIAGAGVLAILAPWLVQALGLAPRFEFLMYFASLAAFVWALVVALRLRRQGQNNQG